MTQSLNIRTLAGFQDCLFFGVPIGRQILPFYYMHVSAVAPFTVLQENGLNRRFAHGNQIGDKGTKMTMPIDRVHFFPAYMTRLIAFIAYRLCEWAAWMSPARWPL